MKEIANAGKGVKGAGLPSLRPANLRFLESKSILVTGGTGSFGQRFVSTLLTETRARRIVVFSRDELKQSEMAAACHDERLRFFLGDVRDLQRLQRGFHGIDFVVHAAALKQVPTLEYNPFEAVLTNIVGAENVINAAIDQGVQKVVALSTDKAANPVNLYGATKLCAEKLFIAGNAYASGKKARFSVVRYGNVVGSRGSVIPVYEELKKTGTLPVTDERMTRFWITLDQSVGLVFKALSDMRGGEIFVPKIASMRVIDLARAVAPGCEINIIGIRPGEKIHETLLTEDESPRARDLGDCFVIQPAFPWWDDGQDCSRAGRTLPADFRYSSDSNDRWLSPQELEDLLEEQRRAKALAKF